MSDELIEINYDDVLHHTADAVQLLIERGDHGGPSTERWVPKSVIQDYTGDLLDDQDTYTGPGSIQVPRWFAEKEGFV